MAVCPLAVEARTVRMVVADLPYTRVWDATVRALADFPVDRAADGTVVTGWRERSPRPEEAGFERVRERVTVRVEPFADRITRVTAEVETEGWRDGGWVSVPDGEPTAREVLGRIRDDQG